MTPQEQFDELSFYTLAHPHPRFLHQHAVDAWAAQTAEESSKTIAIVFGLLGLYLLLEKGYTGRQVQLVHMDLARRRVPLERPLLPLHRGDFGIEQVLAAAPGEPRDHAIELWCRSVWNAYADTTPNTQQLIREFVQHSLHINASTAATPSPPPSTSSRRSRG